MRDNYWLGEKLGQGAFGEVRVGNHILSGEDRAIKFINKKDYSTEKKHLLEQEVEVLGKMDHPNIVKIYEFYDEPKHYCIVQEKCKGGELFKIILRKKTFYLKTLKII